MSSSTKTHAEIEQWLLTSIAAELHRPVGAIDVAKPLTFYGLDSLTGVSLAGDLEDWLGREIAPDILTTHPTIAALSRHLAGEAPAAAGLPLAEPEPLPPPVPGRVRCSDGIDYSTFDFSDWTPAERRLLSWVKFAARATARIDAQGLEQLPSSGPLLIACNHLHILDALWVGAVLPRRTVFLVAQEFERKPIVSNLLNAASVIYIDRGAADRRALDQARAVLAAGGALVVAPEGRLSRTGGLIRGQSGIAYLAAVSGLPVVPLVAFGQEQAGRCWRRLRRVPVHIRVGEPVQLDRGARDLERDTTRIMTGLARTLPPAYRGVYADGLP